jgi:hypothetical protein
VDSTGECIESQSVRGRRYFPTLSHEERVALTTLPHLVPRLRKNRTIHLLPLWAFMACSRVSYTSVNLPVNCNFWIIQFQLYSYFYTFMTANINLARTNNQTKQNKKCGKPMFFCIPRHVSQPICASGCAQLHQFLKVYAKCTELHQFPTIYN